MVTYKDLDVYKRSYRLALEIHQLSLTLPQYLQYSLGDEIRRASRSVPSNIAEGYARNQSAADKISFLKRSLGSANEMLFNLDFLRDSQLIKEHIFKRFSEDYKIVAKQLNRLCSSLKS